MKTYTSTFLALVMAASFAGSAMAEESGCTEAPQSQWMSMSAVKTKANSMGYQVRGIKREGTCYEAKALINGQRRDVVFNPANGNLVDGNELN